MPPVPKSAGFVRSPSLNAVVDLALVPGQRPFAQRAKEHARVQPVAVHFAFELQHEVGELVVRLNLPGPIREMQLAGSRHVELALLRAGSCPAGEVFAVEESVSVPAAAGECCEMRLRLPSPAGRCGRGEVAPDRQSQVIGLPSSMT